MRTSSAASLALALLLAPATPAAAQQPTQDTGAPFTLFNPVPTAQLRDFTPERPGQAHTPITVDAGHIQVESDLWSYSFDRWSTDHTTTRQTVTADPTLKLGLTDWAELDATVPLYDHEEQRSTNGAGLERMSGQGDLMLGGKINLWGNNPPPDQKTSALAIDAEIQLPTASDGLGDGKVEAIIDTPYTRPLPARFLLTIDPGIGLLRQQNSPGYATDVRLAASLARPIIGDDVTAALEVFIDHSTDRATGNRHTLDPSIAWQIGKDLQLDAGAYIGLTKSATDYNPYVGIAWRY